MSWTLAELAGPLSAAVGDSPDFRVLRPVAVDSDDPGGLTFCESRKYLRQLTAHAAGAVIVPPGLEVDRPHLIASKPRVAFETFLTMCRRPLPSRTGVHPTAIVDPLAEVDATASVGPYAVIEQGARIGAGVKVFPFCYVGENCVVGADTVLYPHVVLYQDVKVGARCVLHAHVTLGADGFGFRWDGRTQRKIEHVGGVLIGDDVEIGASSAVDRATAGATAVGDGVKLDNMVQIGHNARIGDHTVICGQSAVAGSSVLGERVTLAGQTGVADHVTVAGGVSFAARTLTTKDIPDPGVYYGVPARPLAEGLRIVARLPHLHERIEKLERGE
ncbi:UDP-3-O-(3-hydroxymyristoyl)glucosamine N-acyltransferase [Kibdelosporangium phytohabitans]|uniref:UDP-3-O-(3-hydroxymyristoyl)glucosamine N-acyltransferase n=1 Tax=Kibdelosporangium phytohabitans TaxID=860235 RepID=UPI0007C84A14|nr:UDP-3-O-(3-hydroxymyristoyl)glucosamine N-acyltransferase [Kibdelosporangium phytohabitans]MBE1469068.1 UDP-3-O-[3-hydroxymyristoyl] glucosamine N-acyltransferase [Kibdelosporangium phytohabitans]